MNKEEGVKISPGDQKHRSKLMLNVKSKFVNIFLCDRKKKASLTLLKKTPCSFKPLGRVLVLVGAYKLRTDSVVLVVVKNMNNPCLVSLFYCVLQKCPSVVVKNKLKSWTCLN